MTQDAGLEVSRTVKRIDELASLVLGHGIDREVTPLEVVFERHVRRGIDRKALVAAPALALGARERVLLLGLRVEKHREVGAHGLEALRGHLFGRGANDHVVAVFDRQAQKLVAYGAADEINFHMARRTSIVSRATFKAPSYVAGRVKPSMMEP